MIHSPSAGPRDCHRRWTNHLAIRFPRRFIRRLVVELQLSTRKADKKPPWLAYRQRVVALLIQLERPSLRLVFLLRSLCRLFLLRSPRKATDVNWPPRLSLRLHFSCAPLFRSKNLCASNTYRHANESTTTMSDRL